MSSGDTQPTLPLPDFGFGEPQPGPRRRSGWPWIIAILVVVGLIVAAWFAGEAIARSLVVSTIREQIITRAGLPADQQIEVDVPGPILPQLIVGSLGSVTVASQDVPLGDSFVGDVTVEALDVPTRGGGDWSGATARVTLDEAQLRALLATVEGFPAETVALSAPDVAMQTELKLFGLTFPLGVTLTPGAQDGEIVLSPAGLQLGGAEISADDLRDRFGSITDSVLRDWSVCVADQLPAGLVLTDVQVSGDQVVGVFELDSGILTDPALQQDGTCA